MTINGINGTNTQAGQMGMNQAMDSYSRNIQNQIANAQKQLQELSSNDNLTLEEKMKKRQEIQQQISDLNMQLRQHQIELRKEKQQNAASVDDASGGSRKDAQSGERGSGLSQAGMTAMISADTSMKRAKVQGSVAAGMEGRAGVLEAEIRTDQNRGVSTEKKEEELADVTQKAQSAAASQMSTLADANEAVEEASKAERTEKKASDTKEEKAAQTENAEDVQPDSGAQTKNSQPAETAAPEMAEAKAAAYQHVDVRL